MSDVRRWSVEPAKFSGFDYLRKITSSIGKRYEIKVSFSSTQDGITHADLNENSISIGETDAWLYGDDYVIGAVLHEVAHIRYSPRKAIALRGVPGAHAVLLQNLRNMVEDERIEAMMAREYEGGAYYLGRLHDAHMPTLVQKVGDNPYGKGYESEAKLLKEKVYAEREEEKTLPPSLRQSLGDKEFIHKRSVFWTILGRAALRRNGEALPPHSIPEWHEAEVALVGVLEAAQKAKDTQQVDELTHAAYKIMEPWAYKERNERGHGMEELAEAAGGHEQGEEDKGDVDAREKARYIMQDEKAKESVGKLKRELIAKMRENDHQRFSGGKLRGKLDKKAIHRTARDNFRVYHKRIERKGKKYAASVILDCSGSMWDGGSFHGKPKFGIINPAMEATAILTRTLRAIGIPTSITIYGVYAKQVLAHAELYSAEGVAEAMVSKSRNYYFSPQNNSHYAIRGELPQLKKAGRVRGRHELMFIITDGGLHWQEIVEAKALLEKEMKTGVFSPMILYVESHEHILNSEKHEQHFTNAEELIPAVVSLVRKIAV